MKTIFIAIQIGRDARDLLRTDTLDVLKEKGYRIVIISPSGGEDYFIREFKDRNVIVEQASDSNRRPGVLFLRIAENLFCRTRFSSTMDISYERSRRKSASWLRRNVVLRILSAVSLLLPSRRLLLKLIRWKYVRLIPDRRDRIIFDKYNPDLVVSTSIFASDDTGILKEAVRRGIPSIAMTPSWDNLTSRGIIPVKVDKLIVWNDIVKEQAVRLHGFKPDDIFVCGGPQFDIYFRREGLVSREEFFAGAGADIRKKLLTYTTGSPFSMPDEPGVVEIIGDFIEQGRLPEPCQLLVRLNPRDNPERYEHLTGRKNIIFERAGKASQSFPDSWDSDRTDMVHLANLMYHSDIVINVASTTAIDAGSFDTPVINIAFDGHNKKTYYDSISRFYDYSHYRDILNSGGVRVAWDKEELVTHINSYLRNPGLDRDGRRRMVEEQCYVTDGTAGRKIAENILAFAESNED